MKILLPVLGLLFAFGCSAQTPGDWQIPVKSSSGPLEPKWVTLSNGQVLGKSGGIPVAITPFSGAFTDLSGKPTTLSGYGITDAVSASGTLALAGFGSITGTLALANIAQGSATSGQVLTWNGSAWAPAAGGGGVIIGATAITSGTSGRILSNNAGVVGEMTTSGSGTVVALTNSPTFIAPALGTPSAGVLTNCTGLPASSLLAGTLGGAAYTIASGTLTASAPAIDITQTWNASAVNFVGLRMNITRTQAAGSSKFFSFQIGGVELLNMTADATFPTMILGSFASGHYGSLANYGFSWRRGGAAKLTFDTPTSGGSLEFELSSDTPAGWSASTNCDASARDLTLSRDAAATLQLGADVNGAAVNQTIKAHDGITGTNVGGANLTLASGDSTGSAESAVIIATPAAGSSGTTARTASERVRVSSAGLRVGTAGTSLTVVRRQSVTLVSGTATVADTATTANSIIVPVVITPGGTVGNLDYDVSAGSSFTINSSSVLDTSTITVLVIHTP